MPARFSFTSTAGAAWSGSRSPACSRPRTSTASALLAGPAHRSRRLAFVVNRTPARSQLMRALAGRNSRCFEEIAPAQVWLLAEDEDAQTAAWTPPALRLVG